MSQLSIIRIAQHPDIDALPKFDGMARERIVVPTCAAEFAAAVRELHAFPCVGFDTESKPTFRVGEVSTGPHLIQFATTQRAYLFRIGTAGCLEAARDVLQAPETVKIGFGLKSDRSRLRNRLGIDLHPCIDLGTVLRYHGKKGQVGLRGAVASVLDARLQKSRSVATSNWANAALSEAQQVYAANDAYGALRVFLGLEAALQQALLDAARRAAPRQ